MFRLPPTEHQRYRELIQRDNVVDAIGFLGTLRLQQSWPGEGDLLRRSRIGKDRRLLGHSVEDGDGTWIFNAGEVVKIGSLAELHWRRALLFTVDHGDAV